jgi:hypothetical protein
MKAWQVFDSSCHITRSAKDAKAQTELLCADSKALSFHINE